MVSLIIEIVGTISFTITVHIIVIMSWISVMIVVFARVVICVAAVSVSSTWVGIYSYG